MVKREEEQAKFDIGLGGIFKGLGDFVELLGELAEKGEELKREGEIKVGRETKGVYGFTIKTGIGGQPTVSSFGNIKRTPKGPVVEEEREPITDVFDEKDEVVVIAEMPGVEEKDIKVSVEGDVLTLEAKNEKKYRKEVILPAKVNDSTLKISYKNGILRVSLRKSA